MGLAPRLPPSKRRDRGACARPAQTALSASSRTRRAPRIWVGAASTTHLRVLCSPATRAFPSQHLNAPEGKRETETRETALPLAGAPPTLHCPTPSFLVVFNTITPPTTPPHDCFLPWSSWLAPLPTTAAGFALVSFACSGCHLLESDAWRSSGATLYFHPIGAHDCFSTTKRKPRCWLAQENQATLPFTHDLRAMLLAAKSRGSSRNAETERKAQPPLFLESARSCASGARRRDTQPIMVFAFFPFETDGPAWPVKALPFAFLVFGRLCLWSCVIHTQQHSTLPPPPCAFVLVVLLPKARGTRFLSSFFWLPPLCLLSRCACFFAFEG